MDIHVDFALDSGVREHLYRGINWGTFKEVTEAISHYTRPAERRIAAYEFMAASAEHYYVKTHELPNDDFPALYVIRDPRHALVSYWKYSNFTDDAHQGTGAHTSLVELILGTRERFWNWSRHVNRWTERDSTGVTVFRYEDLVDPTEKTLRSIASAAGVEVTLAPSWHNSLAEKRRANPHLYGPATGKWSPPPEWTDDIERLFQIAHGDTMRLQGYGNGRSASPREQSAALYDVVKHAETELDRRELEAQTLSRLRSSNLKLRLANEKLRQRAKRLELRSDQH